jgi:NAD(P)-dependent dehydrogenase (short-subunit alcohol dehydrogenase family)
VPHAAHAWKIFVTNIADCLDSAQPVRIASTTRNRVEDDKMQHGRLHGRVAIVTGAAAGIGLAIARRFAQEGARLLIVDSAVDGLAEAAAELGADTLSLAADVTDEDAPGRIVDGCLERFGNLDILVNNAGIGGSAPVVDLPEEDWRRTIETNLTSLFRISKKVLPKISRDGKGRIINISSVFGLVGFRGSSSYAAAKAGVVALTRSMAVDYAKEGITVNAIAPGFILTAMSKRNLDSKPWFRRVMVDATPVPRYGRPEDIAGAAVFLASDDAGFVTGQTLAVDGGWSIARYQAETE